MLRAAPAPAWCFPRIVSWHLPDDPVKQVLLLSAPPFQRSTLRWVRAGRSIPDSPSHQTCCLSYTDACFSPQKFTRSPWLVWPSGTSASLQIKDLPVQFPVRACACIASQVSSRGHMRGNHTLMFLSLSFSLPSSHSLSKNIT